MVRIDVPQGYGSITDASITRSAASRQQKWRPPTKITTDPNHRSSHQPRPDAEHGPIQLFTVLRFTIGAPFHGFATIITIILLLFGLLSFTIGIFAEYVGMIHVEVKGRPNFVIAELSANNEIDGL